MTDAFIRLSNADLQTLIAGLRAKRISDPSSELQLSRVLSTSLVLVSRFAQQFKDKQWPSGCRLPEVYYDPRSVADEEPVRSSLHAKCVAVDAERVFVSSANFTEAGQQRNIEVGLNIQSEWLAKRPVRHFTLLHEYGLAVRAF